MKRDLRVQETDTRSTRCTTVNVQFVHLFCLTPSGFSSIMPSLVARCIPLVPRQPVLANLMTPLGVCRSLSSSIVIKFGVGDNIYTIEDWGVEIEEYVPQVIKKETQKVSFFLQLTLDVLTHVRGHHPIRNLQQ